MVFTSLPLYLDPPNWNNQQSHQQTGSAHAGNELQTTTTTIQPTPMNGGATSAATSGGSIRPNSMADRARMAKIPQPEQALKCPRCDSTNTKFCYFNNYSLSQPRHFCKTCRRYWTRGGALRSVPVGGGCRRNKRSKSSKSSSSTANADRQAGGASSSSSSGSSMVHSNFQHHPQLPFLSSLHTLSEYGGAPNLGLNFAGMQAMDHSGNYQVGVGVGGGGGAGSGIGLDQWRIQQLQHFPFLGGLGLDNSSYAAVMTTASAAGGIYNPFDSEQSGAPDGFNEEVVLPKATSSALISQLASVKMEDSNPQGGLSLARQYLGISGNDQYWGGSAGGGGGSGITGSSWAPGDLSGFNCSSSGNVL